MSVYLLHFDRPYKHARHYVGWAEQVQRRFRHHLTGNGARLVQVVVEAGISVRLARVWWGKSRRWERRMKNRAWGPLEGVCPICCKLRGQPLRRLRTLERAQRGRWSRRSLCLTT